MSSLEQPADARNRLAQRGVSHGVPRTKHTGYDPSSLFAFATLPYIEADNNTRMLATSVVERPSVHSSTCTGTSAFLAATSCLPTVHTALSPIEYGNWV